MPNEKLSIIPLGGRGEIGNNMIIIENEKDLIVLDAGILFPDEDDYGIDLIIPDISYLLSRKDKIRGFIFSHGHEDHIGAIPYIFQMLNAPIYGTDLTVKLIESKLNDFGLDQKVDLNIVGSDYNYKTIELESFKIEFCHVNHSIPASVAMAIHSPVGTIIYTGDYKFDQTPLDSPQTDYLKLSEWGKNGVLALLGDSTNAEREGHTLSERVIAKNIEDKFKLIDQRIIIATFSSNINRIQHIIRAGNKVGRKIAIAGRSMLNTVQMAAELEYLDIPEDMLITLDQAQKMDNDQVILLMTGSQGEYSAALTRMAREEHREIDIIPGDTVFLSASPIPGNEKAVGETINMLYSLGAKVIYGEMLDLHASGHGYREELKMMINLTKPKFLIPVHGEFRHLFHHAQLGREMGIPVENIYITENGTGLELTSDNTVKKDKVEYGEMYIEGNEISNTGDIVLNERKKLAQNGYFDIIIPVDSKGNFKEPTYTTRGFVYNIKSKKMLENSKIEIKKILKQYSQDGNTTDWSLVKKDIIQGLKDYFYRKINRSPFVSVIILEI